MKGERERGRISDYGTVLMIEKKPMGELAEFDGETFHLLSFLSKILNQR